MMLYWVNTFLLWTLCGGQFSDISQPVSFQTVKLGASATIKCQIQSEMYKRVWYRVTTRRELQLVATFNTKYNRSTVDNKFLHRYSVDFDRVNAHLSISQATWEDTGTYYCGAVYLNDIQFGSGTFLMLKGPNMISDYVLQKPESLSVHPGDSVTLSCSVHTGHCSEKHTNVMWLMYSGRSAPQMIYSPAFKNTCERTESGNSICVYNLVMGNLSFDDAGTYHCVVILCGDVLFGNGTKLDFDGDIDIHFKVFSSIGFVILSTIVGVSLAYSARVIEKTNCYNNKGSSVEVSPPTTSTSEGFQDEENDNGEPLRKFTIKRDDTWTECIYLCLKQ